jgi:hypothetical protein
VETISRDLATAWREFALRSNRSNSNSKSKSNKSN